MGDTIKLGLRLFLFALAAAVALAATNEITKGPIAEQANAQANAARDLVLPGIEEFKDMGMIDAVQYPAIQSVHEAYSDGQLEGYAFLIKTSGYKGPIAMTLAVNAGGSINSLVINSQSETAGLGNKITEPSFLNQFMGLAADEQSFDADIDAVSGATISTNAVLSGVRQALQYANAHLGITPKSGVVITEESVNAYKAIEERTGTAHLQPIDAYAAIGYPNIRDMYQADYNGQAGFLFEFGDGSVVISAKGELLSGAQSAHADEAMGYFDQFLKQGVSAE